MTRELLVVLILTVSCVTNSSPYKDFQDQVRNYYDTVYQRSSQLNSEGKQDVNLRMPSVHPTKVNEKILARLIVLSFGFDDLKV